MTGKVTFVGAGPGAADLLTLRGAAAIDAADVVIWAASLVHPDVLRHARPGAEIIDSARLPMEEVLPWYGRLPGRHALRDRLPGDLAGRAGAPLQPRRAGRHDQGESALEAHAGAGGTGAGGRRDQIAPLPPRPLSRSPE